MIIGIYLCAPFLRRMCQNLTDKEYKGLFVLILAISVIKYLLPSFGINIIITNIPFVEWTLIFLLGYLVTRESINKHYKPTPAERYSLCRAWRFIKHNYTVSSIAGTSTTKKPNSITSRAVITILK